MSLMDDQRACAIESGLSFCLREEQVKRPDPALHLRVHGVTREPCLPDKAATGPTLTTPAW